jgi:nitroimidazol reductase NimA-like FMN-containing flavoprotein (pyridoxamine 5'-phosphate oxidase superfamily)
MSTSQEGQLATAQRRQFVREHRTAIFGYGRRDHGPAMTVLYYLMDGDDLLISTMLARGKAKAVQRDPKVSLCVLDENWPPTYITLFCDAVLEATVESDLEAVVDVLVGVLELMAGRELDASAREQATKMAIKEDRVVIRLKPYASFMTPPRHVQTEADLETLTHWTSSSLPWNEATEETKETKETKETEETAE